MKIAIIGTGAVGGYFGAKMLNAGFEVSFLARGKQLTSILENGIRVRSILGDFQTGPVNATNQIERLGVSDLIILAVKAWQIKEVRQDLLKIIHENSIILPLQNGVLAAEELAYSIDDKDIVGGVCRIISKIEAPGVINHFGATPSIVFGELSSERSNRLTEIKNVFTKSEIDSRLSENVRIDIWKKFGFICVGGLMAIARANLSEIRELPETRALMEALITEVTVLASHMRVDMGPDFRERTLSFIDSLPAETTFSMARDIWEDRASELEYLNGAVVSLAEKNNVKVTINSFIYSCLKISENRARS
mgnify:CR=1 FL=1